MTRIIEKRLSLHKNLEIQQLQNNSLKLQIGQLQALANIGVTTCMIAHEINNLLTPIANYAALALSNPDDKSLTNKVLQKTVRNCQRTTKIMESILGLANGENLERKNTLLITLVDEIFSCLCRDFAKDRINVKIQIPENLTVWAVPIEIQQVIMNLILNARDAMMQHGGTLTITALQNSVTTKIEVSDTGSGIDEVNLKKIFEPFFTTKHREESSSQNSGSGLGLAFCKKIIDEHNGSITVESKQAEGTTFRIILPGKQEGSL